MGEQEDERRSYSLKAWRGSSQMEFKNSGIAQGNRTQGWEGKINHGDEDQVGVNCRKARWLVISHVLLQPLTGHFTV